MTIKQIDIKNRTYYFYNDLINIENFDPSMLKLDKKNSSKSRYLSYWIYNKKPTVKYYWCKPSVFND